MLKADESRVRSLDVFVLRPRTRKEAQAVLDQKRKDDDDDDDDDDDEAKQDSSLPFSAGSLLLSQLPPPIPAPTPPSHSP